MARTKQSVLTMARKKGARKDLTKKAKSASEEPSGQSTSEKQKDVVEDVATPSSSQSSTTQNFRAIGKLTPVSRKKWPPALEAELAKMWQEEEHLYVKSLKDYREPDKRQEALQRIAAALGKTCHEVEVHMRSLHTTYSKVKHVPSGSRADLLSGRQQEIVRMLPFLNHHVSSREGFNNIQDRKKRKRKRSVQTAAEAKALKIKQLKIELQEKEEEKRKESERKKTKEKRMGDKPNKTPPMSTSPGSIRSALRSASASTTTSPVFKPKKKEGKVKAKNSGQIIIKKRSDGNTDGKATTPNPSTSTPKETRQKKPAPTVKINEGKNTSATDNEEDKGAMDSGGDKRPAFNNTEEEEYVDGGDGDLDMFSITSEEEEKSMSQGSKDRTNTKDVSAGESSADSTESEDTEEPPPGYFMRGKKRNCRKKENLRKMIRAVCLQN